MTKALSQYVAKSRYARFLDEKGRREHWEETVNRYFDFMQKHLKDKHDYEVSPILRKELQEAVTQMEVMPSMRSIMTAGEALERQNIAGYNCSYLPVDDPKCFDEAMYILLCGTGVGFSVEAKYVNKLPEIPEKLFNSNTTVVVKDSKEGWAKALRQVISLLYAGEAPKWDVSAVRPAGTRLKTFGGRASGPEPLVSLFQYVVSKFKGAVGRKLTSLEVHDILCKIGEVVVVGGVRRSAMISLSDLSDNRMAHAKAGNWWDQDGQRALANNSAVYEAKPDVGSFMREWLNIYESHSGERGIFNRDASERQVAITGIRETGKEWGTNPCSEIILRPYQFCNLSSIVVRPEDTKPDLLRKARLATILGTFQSTMTHFPYLRKVWQSNTEEERLLGVSMTGPLDNPLLNSPNSFNLPILLEEMKQECVNTNMQFADAIGIPRSAAITCIKPEGTVSQLTSTASGLHPNHSSFYIRRIRADNKDPLTAFLKQSGYPNEADVMKPDSTTVFSFPVKAGKDALLRDNLSAVEHLRLWLIYQRHWCHHKPSVTISVKENEWPEVGAWVYEHFDEVTGVSFLPYAGGTYRQAPYEEVDEDSYLKLLAEMPSEIKWDEFIELTDQVEGAQVLACTAGGCEL